MQDYITNGTMPLPTLRKGARGDYAEYTLAHGVVYKQAESSIRGFFRVKGAKVKIFVVRGQKNRIKVIVTTPAEGHLPASRGEYINKRGQLKPSFVHAAKQIYKKTKNIERTAYQLGVSRSTLTNLRKEFVELNNVFGRVSK